MRATIVTWIVLFVLTATIAMLIQADKEDLKMYLIMFLEFSVIVGGYLVVRFVL